LSFPVFGISWYADPADGRSIYAYTGGGGSARTGVFNKIVIQDAQSTEAQTLSTGDLVGLALQIYKHPISQKLWMVVSLGKQVRRYTIPEGKLCGMFSFENHPQLDPKLYDSCVALAVNGMADKLAVGFDSGHVAVFAISDDENDAFVSDNNNRNAKQPFLSCQGHEKAICSLFFSMHGGRILSSAKDGTARVWNATGECLSVLTCAVEDPKMHGAKVLVRGCAFTDLQGQQLLTVASPRRGKAYLAKWIQTGGSGGDRTTPAHNFECSIRTECSPCPISAMSISQDACLLALGAVDGSIILWNVVDWKPFKIFKEVHDLPVTCIAARPYPVPLRGEEWTGVSIHARSASADSQLACLTLQTKVPKRTGESGYSTGGSDIMVMIHRMLMTAVLLWILSPIAREAVDRCDEKWRTDGLDAFRTCVIENVLIAPSWRPGISSPLY
jgi:hypothetical protein